MTLDQTVVQALTAGIEAIVNGALAYDPASKKKIASLNAILAVELSTPHMTFYIQGQEDGIAVLSYCETPVATHLQGSPLALLNLLKQPTSLAGSGVTLVGSVGLLQQWQAILHDLDIDWEDAISQVVGDIAGPLTMTGLKESGQWTKAQILEQQRLIGEYLTEELKLSPSQPEAEQFFQNVNHLKMDVDRLEARIKRIQKSLDTSTQADSDTGINENDS